MLSRCASCWGVRVIYRGRGCCHSVCCFVLKVNRGTTPAGGWLPIDPQLFSWSCWWPPRISSRWRWLYFCSCSISSRSLLWTWSRVRILSCFFPVHFRDIWRCTYWFPGCSIFPCVIWFCWGFRVSFWGWKVRFSNCPMSSGWSKPSQPNFFSANWGSWSIPGVPWFWTSVAHSQG